MKTISISGAIGWDVSPADIRRAIAEADGSEPLDVQISSPGGFVTDGLEIYNLIRAYPGPKTTHLMGLAASMASYIALAGDKVTAEANAVYMIHNALGGAMGNHNDLRRAADVFEGFSIMLARAYAAKTGKPLAEIRALMDAETWYFGAEAKEAGFVDEVIGEPAEDKASAIATGKAARAACDDIVRRFAEEDSLPKLAAMLPTALSAGVASSAAAAPAADISPVEVYMDLDKLKAEHPDLVAAIKAEGVAEGREAGIKAERERREKLLSLAVNEEARKSVEASIAAGESFEEASPKAVTAAIKGTGGENAPQVASAEPQPVADPDFARTAALAGLTAEDLDKYGPKARKE